MSRHGYKMIVTKLDVCNQLLGHCSHNSTLRSIYNSPTMLTTFTVYVITALVALCYNICQIHIPCFISSNVVFQKWLKTYFITKSTVHNTFIYIDSQFL